MYPLTLFVLTTLAACGQDQSGVRFESDSVFQDLTADTVHVSLKAFGTWEASEDGLEPVQWNGPLIPRGLRKTMHLGPEVTHALGKIILDPEKGSTGYLVGCNDRTAKLFVYPAGEKEFTLEVELATYMYLESAYEKVRNSWIADLNDDGILDIATWESLVDFELPNEELGNASRDTRFIYFSVDGEYEYQYWTDEHLQEVSLEK